jgi:hypothetical protein
MKDPIKGILELAHNFKLLVYAYVRTHTLEHICHIKNKEEVNGNCNSP